MVPTASTVGGYLRDLPPDRRVAMARVCSMIRRSARGVRESMRYGLAFYELDGPLFALESGKKHMSLYVAEQSVVERHKQSLPGVDAERSFIKFDDLNRLPLDVVEKIVRDSVSARRTRVQQGQVPTQAELLKLWDINEEAAAAPPPMVRIPMGRPTVVEALENATNAMRDMMNAAFDVATDVLEAQRQAVAPAKAKAKPKTEAKSKAEAKAKSAAKKAPVKAAAKPAEKPAAKPAAKKAASKAAPASKPAKAPVKAATKPAPAAKAATKPAAKPAAAKKVAPAKAVKTAVKAVAKPTAKAIKATKASKK